MTYHVMRHFKDVKKCKRCVGTGAIGISNFGMLKKEGDSRKIRYETCPECEGRGYFNKPEN